MNRFFLLSLVVVSAALVAGHAPAAEQSKPNVLFIAVDDLRDWVGYLAKNKQTKTPNIDRLAARGLAFTHSYCAAPVCNPSRCALMSGLRPFTTGVYENNNDWRTIVPEEQTLTHVFRQAGYFVCGAGKIYHESYPRRSDWDDYLQNEGKLGAETDAQNEGTSGIRFAALDCRDDQLADYKITDYAIAELGKKHDKPFFLACGLHKPHMPWNVPRKYYDMFPLKDIELPPYTESDLDDVPPAGIRMAKPQGDHAEILKTGKWKAAIQGYLAATAYTDMNIGRLLDAFDKSAYKDNTIIVFWCDHGWHLGEKQHWRKFALWEEATHSPLIWVVPGMTQPGSRCERTVDFMTIFPTLCDVTGLPTPAHVQGKSIRTLLNDPKAAWDQPALTTYLFQNHTVRTEDWRYIHYANGDEELYHDSEDPNEWTNLALKPEFAAKKAEMGKFLPTENKPDIGGAKDGEKKKNKNK
jgi:arylsulfatase A-like enzyme